MAVDTINAQHASYAFGSVMLLLRLDGVCDLLLGIVGAGEEAGVEGRKEEGRGRGFCISFFTSLSVRADLKGCWPITIS